MENLLAYTAGYIDGDGCFYIGKNINPLKYRRAIVLSSANREICDFFKKEFGGNCSYNKRSIKFPKHRPISQWYIQGDSAIILSKSLLPFLIEKIDDARMFINFFNEHTKKGRNSLIKSIRKDRKNNNLVTKEMIDIIKQRKCTVDIKLSDYSYLSGFIDAECCLRVSHYFPKNKPNRVYKIALHCNNTKYPVISWAMARFGGSCGIVRRSHKNSLHKDQIYWRLTGKSLLLILPFLIPFLKHKKPVAQKLIEFGDTIQPNGGDRQSQEFKTSYAAIISKRDEIVSQIHLLNSKGI